MHRSKKHLYSITSVALASSDVGKASPSALATLRLIASTYLVGDCTGRSVAPGPCHALDITCADRIGDAVEHNWDDTGRLQQWPHAGSARRENDIRRERNQFRRVSTNLVSFAPGPPDLKPYVATIGPARLL